MLSEIIYKELSYKILGILFTVYKNLGSGHRELYYQRAIAEEFKKQNLIFKEQVSVPLVYNNKSIGLHRVDFLVDNKIVLEIKKDEYFSHLHIKQLHGYLKVLNLQLGILANFTKNGVKQKRILNVF